MGPSPSQPRLHLGCSDSSTPNCHQWHTLHFQQMDTWDKIDAHKKYDTWLGSNRSPHPPQDRISTSPMLPSTPPNLTQGNPPCRQEDPTHSPTPVSSLPSLVRKPRSAWDGAGARVPRLKSRGHRKQADARPAASSRRMQTAARGSPLTCFTKWLPTTAGAGDPLLTDILS